MVQTILHFGRVAPTIIVLRIESFLDVFADGYIFLLDLVAQFNRCRDLLLRFGRVDILKVPFENGQCPFMIEWNDQVGREIVGIDVEHQVGEDPEVERVAELSVRRIPTLIIRLADWRILA